MNWKDMTLRQFLETPIFEPPFAWVKIGFCVAVLVLIFLAIMGVESWSRRS